MHQALRGARQNAVVDEEVLFDGQARVVRFQVARTVVGDAMAQREVLRPCWRADRIDLDEAELGDGARQGCRLEQATGDRVAA
jgi:hypothetical protein